MMQRHARFAALCALAIVVVAVMGIYIGAEASQKRYESSAATNRHLTEVVERQSRLIRQQSRLIKQQQAQINGLRAAMLAAGLDPDAVPTCAPRGCG